MLIDSFGLDVVIITGGDTIRNILRRRLRSEKNANGGDEHPLVTSVSFLGVN